jgi:hypothetical protein
MPAPISLARFVVRQDGIVGVDQMPWPSDAVKKTATHWRVTGWEPTASDTWTMSYGPHVTRGTQVALQKGIRGAVYVVESYASPPSATMPPPTVTVWRTLREVLASAQEDKGSSTGDDEKRAAALVHGAPLVREKDGDGDGSDDPQEPPPFFPPSHYQL